MSSSPAGHLAYFPVQRVAQACRACRRRKCRCTGEHPVCEGCSRRGLACVYDEPQTSRSETQHPQEDIVAPSSSSRSSVEHRLAFLEEKISSIGPQLCRIEQYLSVIASRDQSHTCNLVAPTAGADSHREANVSGSTAQAKEQNDSVQFQALDVSDEVLLALVDTFFGYCHNQPYSFFHEGMFRQRLAEKVLPTHLILAVMASAVRFCKHLQFPGNSTETAVTYADRAWRLILSEGLTGGRVTEVSAVQTIALLGLFDFTAGKSRHGSAWVKVGIAVRIAQDCRLMLDPPAEIPVIEQEERRRVFWSVYLLDRLVSCGRGRPPAIVDASCHLQLPCEDDLWKHGIWKKTLLLDQMTDRTLVMPERQGKFARLIAMAHIMGRCAQYTMQEFNIRSPHPLWESGSDFAAIESDLLHAENFLELQSSMEHMLAVHVTPEGAVDHQETGPIIYSRALFHLCHCLLHHPFLLRRRLEAYLNPAPASFLSRAFITSWQHAQQMVHLIRDTRSCGGLFNSSFGGYCLTVAGSVLALWACRDQAQEHLLACSLLQENISYVEDIGHYWPNVKVMASLLQRVADQNHQLGNLCDAQQVSVVLSPFEAEMMWSIVDYSTMSNDPSAELSHPGLPIEDNVWPDSWIALFGLDHDQDAMRFPV